MRPVVDRSPWAPRYDPARYLSRLSGPHGRGGAVPMEVEHVVCPVYTSRERGGRKGHLKTFSVDK